MAQQAVQHIHEESDGGGEVQKEMGTFRSLKEVNHTPERQGPVFVANPPSSIVKISDIKETAGLNEKVLATFDERRLSGLVAQEAINLGKEKRGVLGVKNLRKALYALDPVKYRFLAPANDETFSRPKTKKVEKGEKKEKPKIPRPTFKSIPEIKVPLPKKKTLDLVRDDINSLGVKPPSLPKALEEHPLLSRVRPPLVKNVSLVSPSPKKVISVLDEKKVEEQKIQAKGEAHERHESREEKSKKMKAVNELFGMLFRNVTDPSEIASPLRGQIPKEQAPIEQVLRSGLPVIETTSWRDSLDGNVQLFAKDIMTLSEEELLMKCMGLDRSASNAALVSNASNADTYDILQNPNTYYEKREELSQLIENMKKVASYAGIVVTEAEGLTIHMMHEQVRAVIATADSRENR